MEKQLQTLLENAIYKYGVAENICSPEELKMKWDRYTSSGAATIPSKPEDIRVRSAIITLGRILEENKENHTYTSLVKVKKGIAANESIAVVLRNGASVQIATCAKEGLINQGIAKKAVEMIENAINSLPVI